MNPLLRQTWFIGILLLAGLLFAWGMTSDLPYTRLGIEQEHVNLALKCGSGDLNPHFFIHPPLMSYVLFAFYGVAFLIARAAGWMSSVAAFEQLYFTDPTLFYVIARVFIGAMGLASVAIFYGIARRLFDERRALAATFLMAIAPELVRWAHYAVSTVFMLCLFMAAFWFVVTIFEGRARWRDYAAFGVLTGLSMAAKYDGGLVLLPFLTAHVMASRQAQQRWWRDARLWAAAACVVAAYLLGAWYTVVDLPRFIRDWKFLYDTVAYGALTAPGSRITKPGWLYLLLDTLPFGWSLPVTILALAGVANAVIRRSRTDWLLLGMALTVFVLMSRWQLINSRYFVQVMPFLILLGVDWLFGLMEPQQQRNQRAPVAMAVIVAALAVMPLVRTTLFLSRVVQVPPATQAKDWLEAHVPSGTKIATLVDLPIVPNEFSIRRQLEEIERKRMGKGERLRRLLNHQRFFASTYDVYYLRFPSMAEYDPEDFDFTNQVYQGIRYFILDGSVDEYLAEPASFPAQVQYIERVRQWCRLVKEFREPWVDVVPLMRAPDEYLQVYVLDDPKALRQLADEASAAQRPSL